MDEQLKSKLNELLDKSCEEILNSPDKKTDRIVLGKIIAKAVQLGMSYQEAKIKEGIKIVFDEL